MRRFIFAVLIVGVLLTSYGAKTTQAQGSGSLELDCNTTLVGAQSSCRLLADTALSIAVTGVAPTVGYAAWQGQLDLNGLQYADTVDPNSESTWPSCTFAARKYNNPLLLYGCVDPALVSTYSGQLAAFQVGCTLGVHTVSLLAGNPVGSYYLDSSGQVLATKLGSSITITCVSQCSWADLNNSGNITVSDIGIVAAGFGRTTPDLTGDNVVTIADILLVAREFGHVC